MTDSIETRLKAAEDVCRAVSKYQVGSQEEGRRVWLSEVVPATTIWRKIFLEETNPDIKRKHTEALVKSTYGNAMTRFKNIGEATLAVEEFKRDTISLNSIASPDREAILRRALHNISTSSPHCRHWANLLLTLWGKK